jgi:hypothetical protein
MELRKYLKPAADRWVSELDPEEFQNNRSSLQFIQFTGLPSFFLGLLLAVYLSTIFLLSVSRQGWLLNLVRLRAIHRVDMS